MKNTNIAILMLATALVTMPFARAQDPPALKEGLWSVHTESIDNPGNHKMESNYKLCRDHSFDRAALASVKTIPGCKVQNGFRDGKFSSVARCSDGKQITDVTGTTTYQGDTSTHTESQMKVTAVMGDAGHSTTVVDQKYIGVCPAGVQPGDRITPDGKVQHDRKR